MGFAVGQVDGPNTVQAADVSHLGRWDYQRVQGALGIQ